ncbi:ABC transporter permease [Nocardioides sp. CN2-186]|uniref:ABC transporter permease n=1 Tax=Nocardioides tweenelious TaxID=3156607 RepID=UPI0032B33B2F
MLPRPRLHAPSIVGRMRTDPGPLVLIAVVVALTTALLAVAGPLTTRASDHALADAVRKAGAQGSVVGTFPRGDAFYDTRTREPRAAEKLRAAVTGAQLLLPDRVADVVQPGITAVTTTPLQLLDAGPGRYLSLAYLDTPAGAPAVRYTAGGPPRASVGSDRASAEVSADAPPWRVQVALSSAAAEALGLQPGDRLTMKDLVGRPVVATVSGIYVPHDPGDLVWQPVPQLLHPTQGVSDGVHTSSAAAIVSAAALPDLQLAVPTDDLNQRIYAAPRPDAVRWSDSEELVRTIGALKAAPPAAGGPVWDSALDQVLEDGRSEITAARGQADVLLLSLLVCALLVLCLAADLLVRRRATSVLLTRERGGTLAEIAAELFLEAAGWVAVGVVVGVLGAWWWLGEAGWSWGFVVPFVAAGAAGARAAFLASRATDPRRTPANRNARRVVARARQLRRVTAVTAVVAAAALSFVALRQRGVGDGEDLTAAGAPVWWAVAGTLLVVAAVPALTGLLLDAARRTSGSVAFFVAARVRETGARALPLVVITVTVAQLTFALALTSTEQRGQADGALLSVGGDARATLSPGRSATKVARAVDGAPGVTAAVAARIDSGVPATSTSGADTVLLTVVDASAYEHLLAVSALPDAPQLATLAGDDGTGVPALLLGGASGLQDGFSVRSDDGPSVRLRVVGRAPQVQDTFEPVVVVDATAYARAGGLAEPDTVWAVGPGAASALQAQVRQSDEVVTYADELDARRDAPVVTGLVRLAVAASLLLLLFALLGVVMAAASEADSRAASLGRLRALGTRDRQLRRVLGGELLAPVLIEALAGLALGLSAAVAMFGQLSLESVTGQVSAPSVSIPWWVLVGPVALVAAAVVLTQVEWVRLRGIALGQLLRGGSPR